MRTAMIENGFVLKLVYVLLAIGLSGCHGAEDQAAAVPETTQEQTQQVADEPASASESHSVANPSPETAAYDVPDTSQPATNRFVAALDSIQGLISAEMDADASQLLIAFTPDSTNPQEILNALTEVEPSVSFAGVRNADNGDESSSGHNCGSCPMRNQCDNH